MNAQMAQKFANRLVQRTMPAGGLSRANRDLRRNNPIQRTAQPPAGQPVQRSGDLTVSDLATIYGCCGLFDMCSDADLMSLTFEGASPFLDWLGWERTDVCVIKKNFITFTRAEGAQGEETPGWLANPCADPHGVEWGTCDFTLTDFARLRRQGPTRDITKTNLRYCEAQPRYRLDGTRIEDDREYDMVIAVEVLMQDLKDMVVAGNATTDGQFDGLERLIRSGYTNSAGRQCTSMDSIVLNWNNNGMDGGAGITWNGAAVAATYDFIAVLRAVYKRIRHRIRLAPSLAAQRLAVGDIVLVLPEDFVDCILDAYTCWSVCDSDADQINTLEARRFRDNLMGGMFGAGRIFLDSFEIPVLPYDWGLIKGPSHFDAYLLTGSVGNVKVLQGQYNDMEPVSAKRADRYMTDGGRLLTWREDDHTCEEQIVEMQPRLLAWAPWAQARFQNVVCNVPGGPLSADPWETSFFPESSFSVAECPPA